MISLLLAVIYLAFISLGLPDSLLGSAWPVIYPEFSVPISSMGIISMTICFGTIISSLLSDHMIRRFGTGKVTAISVALTAIALYGFSVSTSFAMLCIWAVPYGLGAGSVDAGLNNFVALHYKSRHMNWLHCFWGVGASIGPSIMGFCLTGGQSWHAGYRTVAIIQTVLVAFLLLSLPLWKKVETDAKRENGKMQEKLGMKEVLALKGARTALVSFFSYCAMETTAALWASSFLVLEKGIEAETAASWAALFYLGITIGRGLSGFIADRLGDTTMIRLGEGIIATALLFLFLPLPSTLTLCSLVLFGIGCAPVYPSMLHMTTGRFGANHSQAIMGLQMACAYIGSTFAPPLFGLTAGAIGIWCYPYCLVLYFLLLLFTTERGNKTQDRS
jgi:fucose permease